MANSLLILKYQTDIIFVINIYLHTHQDARRPWTISYVSHQSFCQLFSSFYVWAKHEHILVCFFFCPCNILIYLLYKKKRINTIIFFIPFFIFNSSTKKEQRAKNIWLFRSYSHLPTIQFQYNESSFSYYNYWQTPKSKPSNKTAYDNKYGQSGYYLGSNCCDPNI